MKKLIIAFILALFLTGCGQYVVEVNLTPEERAKYEAFVVEYKEKIQKWGKKDPSEKSAGEKPEEEKPTDSVIVNSDDTTVIIGNEEESIKGFHGNDPRVPFYYFVDLALAQEKLGQLDAAINTYQRALNYYENSHVAWNNLARLYEYKEVRKYRKAIAYHQKQIDQFDFVQYYIDIANDYIKLGDLKSAEKAYNQYRFETNLSDAGVESGLAALRSKLTPQE